MSEQTEIGLKSVLHNLEGFKCWDWKHYPLTKKEYDVVLPILKAELARREGTEVDEVTPNEKESQ